ncbi:hypothetical protein B0A49_03343 [Cryomyces minteri]|uniref:Glycerate kinase n=1 Tax=Cryomyces minteri TaxID=331657 RepID=A0A4U0XPP5_9PEZI|nr:hypothetical protein B0A49_03343 [Cryomyces minteri]
MKILIAPSGFKESLSPHSAAQCIETGIRRALPTAETHKAPLVDGGELRRVVVTGPVRQRVRSHYGFLGGCGPKTAVVEMAASAGLRLVPRDQRNPCLTTTYGVGETIVAAMSAGAERILVGCGDSGTCDGGVGMAQALGARFVDRNGGQLPLAAGGASLASLAAIRLAGLHPRLRHVARVFGPQKGATPAQVEELSAALDNYAAVLEQEVGFDVSHAPGSGASGGLAAGLLMIGATLHPRYQLILPYFHLDCLLAHCDLVFTAEGGLDAQTARGKIPAEVARRAKYCGRPVIALAGTIGENAAVNYEVGIDAFASVMQAPTTLEDAMQDAERLLVEGAESAMRMVMVGAFVSRRAERELESKRCECDLADEFARL